MRILPSGTRGLLIELDGLEEVLAMYAALQDDPPPGVVDIVPAADTILVSTEPGVSLSRLAQMLAEVRPRAATAREGEVVEIPVHYDGADLADVARLMGCSEREVVARHTSEHWTVAFCGFAPGFGYLTGEVGRWSIPRRSSPRTRVPAGSIALAGQFTGVYPAESPGGWQLLGRTDVAAFDLHRDPAALLRPGVSVRFVELT